jgi:predicted GNAT family N-acyltransferase
MELISNYKENDNLRKSFNELSQKTFGISFEEWYQKQFWKDKYECYSLKHGDRIVANASVSKLKFLINAQEKKALQIGTVMTAAEYKGRGFSRQLMEHILAKFEKEYDIIYLFANNSVLEFYPKFGFFRVAQAQLFTTDKIPPNNKYNLRKLNMDVESDVNSLKRIAENRISNSTGFDVKNGQEVLYWYCLNVFRENIYFDENKNLIIIYTFEKDRLLIHDIIITESHNYRELIGSLVTDKVKEIIFNFNLDAENIKLQQRLIEDDDNVLFMKGDFDPDMIVIHPITSHA